MGERTGKVRLFLRVAVVLVLVPGAALAESTAAGALVEVHAVGVYEGSVRTNGQLHGPISRVSLDRPGAEVILLLGSYEPVRWIVDVAPGTVLRQVVLHGFRPQASEVILEGAEAPVVRVAGLPYSYQPEGESMRTILDRLPQIAGTDRLASFTGACSAPEEGFFIDPQKAPVPAHDPGFLAERAVAIGTLPQPLQRVLEQPALPEPEVRFGDDGFLLRDGAGGRPTLVPLSLDVPPVSWPVAAARDPVTGVLYGVSLGGEGYLYAHDPATGVWRVASSMNQADASGMIFDTEAGRLVIAISGMVAPHGPALYFFGRDGRKARTVLSYDAFAGLSDLYDPGNDPEPGLVPLAVASGKLLVIAVPGMPVRRSGVPVPGPAERLYVIDMATGAVDLVRRDGAEAGSAPEPWSAAAGRGVEVAATGW